MHVNACNKNDKDKKFKVFTPDRTMNLMSLHNFFVLLSFSLLFFGKKVGSNKDPL